MEQEQEHRADAVRSQQVAAPVVETPAPASPVALPVGSLVVGHAEDAAEADADRMADRALSRLAAVGPDTHQHGPGCEHVRRTATPLAAGSAAVGYEGGALDAGTTAAIEGRRGAGRPLDPEVRGRMQTAFGADFSNVRVHDDSSSHKLNRLVSARAFTTGKDIFFGRGEYAPDSPASSRVLAHELAHTLQPAGSAHRLHVSRPLDAATRAAVGRGVATTDVIHRWDWWDKRKARQQQEKDEAKKKKDDTAYSGVSGAAPSRTMEIVKPLGAGAAVGAVALGTALGAVGGGVGETLGGILTGDSSAGVKGAFTMADEAEEFQDKGLGNLASRKKKAMGAGLLGAAISTTGAGVQTGFMHATGTTGVWDAAKLAGETTLGTAAGAVGVAGGSMQVLQGAWRGGKAVMKLCRLAYGRAKTMLSPRGEKWKKAIVSAERYKAAIAAMKVTLGVLGIAAGALLIVSNPIGWGIGIAAAIAGGAYAATKIAGKIKNAHDRTEAAKKVAANQSPFADLTPAPASSSLAARKRLAYAGDQDVPYEKDNSGFREAPGGGPTTEREKTRAAAIAQANAVGREASEHALLADELRGALSQGDKDEVLRNIDLSTKTKNFPLAQAIPDTVDRELHDAFLLLSSINVEPLEALADSGQELIEKKLSKVESM